MTIHDLRREYQQSTIGQLILSEVDRVVRSTERNYDPITYGGGVSSWSEGHEDLVQEVVLRVLLEERQLDYLMDTASTIKDFRALLRRQVERQLARRRRRTVIDNLLDRSKSILEGEEFTTVRRGPRAFHSIASKTVEERSPTGAELRRAAIRASAVPRIPYRDSERAPQVYSTDHLARLLRIVGASLPTWFEIRDLDWILHDVLTGWVPSLLEKDEAVHYEADTALNPEDELIADSTTDQLYGSLTQEQRLILVRKIEGASDLELARELGVSRPTAAGRKDEVLRILGRDLGDLPRRLQSEVIDRVTMRAASEVAGA